MRLIWNSRSTQPMMNRSLTVVFISTLGALTSFFLLVSALPLYVSSLGAGSAGAGAVTGVLMLSTVLAEFATPRLVAAFGYRIVTSAGLVLLGLPSLALVDATTTLPIIAICFVRGAGFAMTTVVYTELVARLVPPERRGEAIGIYGIVDGAPAILALPLGIWLARSIGFSAVFVVAGVSALAPLLLVSGLPRRSPQSAASSFGIAAGLQRTSLVRPAVALAGAAMASGIVLTFLPLAILRGSRELASVALFVEAVTATVSGWWAGRYGDKHGHAGLFSLSIVGCALGVGLLVLIPAPLAVMAGAFIFGLSFGVAQNTSLAMMFERTEQSGYATASAMWSLGYDGGFGLGAMSFGVVALHTGYRAAFGMTALVVLAAFIAAWYERDARRMCPSCDEVHRANSPEAHVISIKCNHGALPLCKPTS